MEKASRLRGCWKPALVAAVVAIALLGIAEAVARHLYPTPPLAPFVMHPFLGPVRPPGYSIEKISIDTGKPFPYEVDALGFRGKSLTQAKKAPGTYRIFFVGASTTENPNTPEELTFPGLVEAKLNERFHGSPRIEVGNAGISGGTSANSLAQVAHRILSLEPDLVVVLDSLNDFIDSLRDDWDPTTYNLARTQRPRFKEWLEGQSRLVAVLDAKFGLTAERDARDFFAMKAAARRERPVREPDFPLLRGLDIFRANQRRLVLLCHAEGVECALMSEPTLYKKGLSPEEDARLWNTLVPGTDWNLKPETLLAGLDAYNASVGKTAQENGAIFVDLAARVPHDLADFADDVHFTQAGNAAVAASIVEKLLEKGDLPRFKRP